MTTMSRSITVLLVDEDTQDRQTIRRLLSRDEEISVVGEAASAGEAIRHIRELQPRVVMLDIGLAQDSDIDITRVARAMAPDTRILIMTRCHDIQSLNSLIAVRASAACDPSPNISVAAQSDEPDDSKGVGDGMTTGDIKVTNPGGDVILSSSAEQGVLFDPINDQLELRAERGGGVDGRAYTVEVSATDASGNVASALAAVTVRRDQRDVHLGGTLPLAPLTASGKRVHRRRGLRATFASQEMGSSIKQSHMPQQV